ncbi:MAG TPA: ABC transporter permease [Opitutus sp.]|nr:ABC transporter permease [Opitutus sp.]
MAGVRASWLSRAAGGVLADLRQALRQLRKAKGISAAVLVTLALGIGATTAIFSMVYTLMLKPLPFDHPDRLIEIFDSARKAGLNKMPSNVVQFVDYQKNAGSYETLALWRLDNAMFGEPGAETELNGSVATGELFGLLRVQPVIGRFFTRENSKEGADKVVVLTQSFWQTEFAEDPGVIGRKLRLDGESYEIVGVAPRELGALDARMKYLRPFSWSPQSEDPNRRYGLYISMFGRLKPGVSLAQANAEAAAIEKRYYDAAPPPTRTFMERSGIKEEVGGMEAERVQPVRTTLLLLQGGVAFVLLIGCANVANLLLVRSNARQAELAIRAALGAGHGIIARQLLVESLLLTGLGAALGIGVAWGALRAINHYAAKMLPQALAMALDWRVLGFAVALAVAVGVLIGLAPVWHVLRTNLAEVIQRGSRGASSGRGVRALSSTLVVVQVAVALMLLTGAGLLIHSFAKVLNVDPGFDPRHVVVGRLALPGAYRASDEAAKNIQERLRQALAEIPGVSGVAFSFSTPFRGGIGINAMTLAEDPLPPGSPQPGAWRVNVSPEYFATLKLRLVEGRFLEKRDEADNGRHFVVDESFARKFFPNKSAIGGRFTFGSRPEKDADWPTVVGVVRDVPHNGVEDKSGSPFAYQLLYGRPGGLTWFLRSERPEGDVIAAVRAKVREIDPTIPVFDTSTLEKEIGGSFDSRRAVMLLLAAFAGIALFLSALGIYGVLAYDVSQRTREIGVRGAIGATAPQIIALILKQGLWKAGIGLVIGLVGAALLSRTMASLLFQVQATDPVVYVAVALVLLAVAALASWLPARRAARIDPIRALREE